MANVPSPPTFVVRQKLTAALMNGFRDYVNFLTAPPLVVLTNSGSQTILPTTQTALTFDTEAIDTDNMHSLSTNTSRITCVTPGWYSLSAVATFSFNGAGSRFGSFVINGSSVDVGRDERAADSSTARGTSVMSSLPVLLSAGDYVEFTVWQNLSGINLTVTQQRLSALWVHS